MLRRSQGGKQTWSEAPSSYTKIIEQSYCCTIDTVVVLQVNTSDGTVAYFFEATSVRCYRNVLQLHPQCQVLGVRCQVKNVQLQVLGVSEKLCRFSEVLGVNRYICCSFIKVLSLSIYFCRFCEVLGVITKIGKDPGKCQMLSVILIAVLLGCSVLTHQNLKFCEGVICYSIFLKIFKGVRC